MFETKTKYNLTFGYTSKSGIDEPWFQSFDSLKEISEFINNFFNSQAWILGDKIYFTVDIVQAIVKGESN